MPLNTARRTLQIWAAITLISVAGIFAPEMLGMDGMDGGFALSAGFLLLAITGIIVVVMYRQRARAVDLMLKGDSILARWTFTPQEWEDYTRRSYQKEHEGKWPLYKLVMAITAVVCAGFWIFVPDSGVVVLVVFGGLGILLAAAILFSTGYDRWQNERFLGEVIISRDGAYVNRRLHLWKAMGTRLDGVEYSRKDRMLEFTYSALSRTGRNYYTAFIPVPSGAEQEADRILQHFKVKSSG